jgi:hypothetical protein
MSLPLIQESNLQVVVYGILRDKDLELLPS